MGDLSIRRFRMMFTAYYAKTNQLIRKRLPRSYIARQNLSNGIQKSKLEVDRF